MQLRILNCPDKDFKPFVERAAQFFAKELIPNTRIRNNCLTEIHFDNKLDEYGFASVEDYNSRKQPRHFIIELNPLLGSRRILETLAHEMVHIKQYIFSETNDELTKWRNKKIDPDKIDYWVQPWEIDAYGRETGLLTKFAISEHLWEIFDDFVDPSAPIQEKPIAWKKIKRLYNTNIINLSGKILSLIHKPFSSQPEYRNINCGVSPWLKGSCVGV